MERLLDELNGRSYELNTIEGAKKLAEDMLKHLPDRLAHTNGVVTNLLDLLTYYKPVSLTKEEMKIAGYLHAIGYSASLLFSNFYPYDGYLYLKANGWTENICNLVLLHSFSRELSMTEAPELFPHIVEVEHKTPLSDLLIITYADFTSNQVGKNVTVYERYRGILERYGYESNITRHAKIVQRALEANHKLFKKGED